MHQNSYHQNEHYLHPREKPEASPCTAQGNVVADHAGRRETRR